MTQEARGLSKPYPAISNFTITKKVEKKYIKEVQHGNVLGKREIQNVILTLCRTFWHSLATIGELRQHQIYYLCM